MDENYKKLLDKKNVARQNYKGPFCCFDMDSMLADDDVLYSIKYDPKIRKYYLESLNGPYIRSLEFCSWCGSKLPKSLKDEWFDILEQEYGLDDPGWPEQEQKMPVEFKTDEWWKKRGL